MSRWLDALRHKDREILLGMEADISTPSSAGGGVGPIGSRLYARLRHEALYGAIRTRRVMVASSWKVTLAAALRRGDVFLDVGGNVGRISHAASWLVGRHGQVHAFEPSPEISDVLRHRALFFGLDNVTINQVALSAHAGEAVLHEYAEGRGGSSSLRAGSSPGQRHDRETAVPVATLDDYVADKGIQAVRLLKIDVEGAELDVIRGALRTLETLRPVLLVEASHHTSAVFGYDLDQLIDAIHAQGYEIFSWRTRRLVRVRSAEDVPGELHHDDFLCLDGSAHQGVRARLERLSRNSR